MYTSYSTLQRKQLSKQVYTDTQSTYLLVYAPGRHKALETALQNQLHRKFRLVTQLEGELTPAVAGVLLVSEDVECTPTALTYFAAALREGADLAICDASFGFDGATALYLSTQHLPGSRCALVLAATALSEAVSTALMALFYRREAARCFGSTAPRPPREASRRLWDILWPVEGGRVLSSALHTAENMRVPACLAVYLAASGGRTAAREQSGTLKGMALPLLNFPFGLLGSLAVLLMPEITQAHIEGQTARLNALLDRMLRLTGYFSALAGTLFWVWGRPLAQLLYHSPEAGFYLETLAPAMPLMYLESMVDGAMKGIGEQKAAFRYSVWDAVLRIGGVAVLLPRYGMRGFLAVILLSSLYTCAANTGRLLLSSGTGHAFRRWLGAPLLAAAAAGAAGRGVRRVLAGFPAQRLWEQIAVLTAGGTVTAAVFLLAALPLGLWEEVRALLRQAKTGKNRGK